jgi:NADH-quinone oxidoreductase subunit N
MTAMDLIVLTPILLTAVAVLILMLAVASGQSHRMVAMTTALSLVLKLGAIVFLIPFMPRQVTPLLLIDRYGLFFIGLIVGASLVVTMLGYAYWQESSRRLGELYILILLATLGAEVLVIVDHFASFFLGLELLSISLYALVAYTRTNRRALEAGIKYLILSAASSSFLVFGMAVLYFDLGTLAFPDLQSAVIERNQSGAWVLAGLVMILIGIAFKLGLAPFHIWTPDVYEGAPVLMTAFLATVSKGAVIGLFLRFFLQMESFHQDPMILLLSAMAVGSMFVGNWLALLQDNIKRLLAYSSIAHMGYLLVALLAGGALAAEAVGYYLIAYIPTLLGAFGVILALSGPGNDADSLEQYRGLLWRNPGLAAVLSIMMLSLAGIPLTAGFLAKFYVVTAGLTAQRWGLVLFFIVNSLIGLFYYLRVLRILISELPTESPVSPSPLISPWGTTLTLGSLVVFVVGFGIYPDPIMHILKDVGEHLTG